MQQTVTALFENRSYADAAVEKLVQAGVERSSINVLAGQDNAYTAQSTGSYDHARDEGGFWSSLKDMFMPEEDRYAYSEGLKRGGVMVAVRTDTAHVHQAEEVLESAGGSLDLDQEETRWRSSGWTGYTGNLGTDATATTNGAAMAGAGAAGGMAATRSATDRSTAYDTGTSGTSAGAVRTDRTAAYDTGAAANARTAARGGQDETISVYEENLTVGKRVVDRGRVRLRSYVVETPVNEQVSLRDETVEIDRHRVDRAATAAEASAFPMGDKVIEVEAHSEEAMVSKDLRVTEEVGLRKTAGERTETIKDKVRHTEVEVDDTRVAGSASRADTTTGAGTRKPI